MKPLFHELLRTFTSKTVLILLVVIVLFSSLSAYTSAQNNTSTSQGVTYILSYGYGANDTYHIFTLLANQNNIPVSGAEVNLSIGNGTVYSEYSNVQGYANFTLSNLTPSQISSQAEKYFGQPNNISNEVYVACTVTENAGSFESKMQTSVPVYLNQSDRYFFTTITPTKESNGTIINKTQEIGRYELYSVNIPGQPSRYGFDMWYEGKVGAVSPEVGLYYESFTTGPNGGFSINTSSLTESNMTYFGSYSSFSQLSINPSNLSSTNSTMYVFAIFTPGGKLVAFNPMQIYTPATVSQVNVQFFGTEMSIIGLFVPLMAVVSGYMTFGKDKASGALKSTIVRPVTRRGVIMSRFFANVSAVFLASVIAFLVSSLVFSSLLGVGLPVDTVLYGLFAILVSITAYTGIVYLASSVLRTQGSILAAAIGSFVVMDILWSSLFLPVIPFAVIILVLKATSGSIAFAKGYYTLFYFSPSGYANIASYIITNQNPIYVAGKVTASQLGVSTFKFILGGLLWIILPVVLALVAFIKRD